MSGQGWPHTGRNGRRPAGKSEVKGAGPARPRAERTLWPVRSGAVPPLAENFTARTETAPDLEAVLTPGAVLALVPGPANARRPGEQLESSGKTQLAVSVAEQLWRSHAVELLVWIVATSRASVLAGLAEAAAALGADPADPTEPAASRFVGWLGTTARPWLVVFDDLRDAADLDGLLPHGPAGRVLITTRDELTVSGDARTQLLRVGAFSDREALSLVRARLTGDPDKRNGAVELAVGLDCEPSALAQASAMIAASKLSCSQYQDYATQRRAHLASAASGRPPAADAVTWTASVEQATLLCPGGAGQFLLVLAALLDRHAIPGALFTSSAVRRYLEESGIEATDPASVRAALLSLVQTGLLAVDQPSTPTAVWLTSSVQTQVRASISEQLAVRAASAAAEALLEIWPQDESEPWSAVSLRSCAAGLQQAAGDRLWTAEGCHPILLRTGLSLDGARLTGPAVDHWTRLTADGDRILGLDCPNTLMIGSLLARALLAAGRAVEAASWSQRVLEGLIRTADPGHLDIATTRVEFGRALLAAGQPGHAVTVLGEAVDDFEHARGADHLETIGARTALAAACEAVGEPAEAVALYRRALADRERVQGADHPDTITARDALARACLANGQVKEAVSGYKRALADRERVLGRDHPDTIATRSALAGAYLAVGRMGPALQLYEQVCADCERALGAEHTSTFARRGDLARAYHAVGRLADALALLRETVSRCEQVLPPGDPLTQELQETITSITHG